VRAGLIQLPIAIALMVLASRMRVQIRPGFYQVGLAATTLAISGLILFGISGMLLFRSPFRMPPGERAFRAVWLGAFGRWFLRRAAKGVKPGTNASMGATGAAERAAPVLPVASTGGVTLAELDKRVRAIERKLEVRG
jgi:anti-sigma factor RsiW